MTTATVTPPGPYELPDTPRPRERPYSARADQTHLLVNATRFSDDRQLTNPRWVVRQMKRFPLLWGPIERMVG